MTFRLVSFHYPEEPDKQVLNNMSLEVRPGQTTALVGPSGCGKSTVFKLIERFYDVTFGALEVDGIALSDLNLGWWRDKVCVVQDNPELAGDSISEIITYGDTRNDISLEEVKEAATTAGIHQFIMTLPRGYYTCVEGRGRQAFTPEQRVRLAMARAVFRSPRFLLVDNVTSSLQPNTDEILRTLEQVKKDCTCIIATRYIAEITKADNIAVMSHGKVIEQGTHWELMALRGCYFVMLRKQEAENKSLVKKKEERKQKRIFFQRKLAESVIKQHGVGHLMSYSSRIASTSTTF
ncbi:multidrug resistance protein pgp-1-like [Babylonia areolata]|uniref:multidrug resistance protein pgp-1-like n=1 Tax=Babylonia areolata TaxID=304850 RepID=UPI003FD53EBF